MAYGTIVASVSEESISNYRADASAVLDSSMSIFVSHLLAYWIQVEQLGNALGKCIDGGEKLAPRLWHPLRVPLVHSRVAVADLAKELERAWSETQETNLVVSDDDFFGPQIINLVKLFVHATANDECVITFLDRPGDKERASRVEIPRLKR